MSLRLPVRATLAATLFVTSLSAQKAQRPIYFNFDAANFSATGKWIPADPNDKPPFPAETQIDCTKAGLTCTEATAEYYYGHPHVTLLYFKIIKWDANGIVASSSEGICATNTILISFAEKTVSETDSMKQLDDKTKAACNFFGIQKAVSSDFILKGSVRWDGGQ